jgi:hypothetical protein
MLTLSDRSGVLPVPAASRPIRRPARGYALRLLRIAALRAARLIRRWRGRAAVRTAGELDEVGESTRRDLGLLDTHRCTPYELADIDAGLESTRMRLFVMTGHYWRGS